MLRITWMLAGVSSTSRISFLSMLSSILAPQTGERTHLRKFRDGFRVLHVNSDFFGESIPLSSGYQFLVCLGESIVLDQARKMFEFLLVEEDPQMRRCRLEIINRGSVGLRQVVRQLLYSCLNLSRIACWSRFAVRCIKSFQSLDELG